MSVSLPHSARAVIEGGALGHLVTLNPEGSAQVAIVWVGIDGEELVTAHLSARQQKLKNVQRDPRVVLSFEASSANPIGMRDYLVVHGRATIVEGRAPELLQRLAQVNVGPGTRFPPMPDPPPGFLMRIAPERIGGQGPWMS
ncbi:MAG: pyridoxamine 5'-phosphate oxidase family protein [Chloroflexi bacterium]|nr:pyridoxamine 5'-phosphate oxidase family protein [Chloroflexota bacterium]